MKHFLRLSVTLLFLLYTTNAYALIHVIDIAALAKLAHEIEQLKEMIGELNRLTHWGKLDHKNIGTSEFNSFLSEYSDLFNQVMDSIDGYQNGGLMGQIERLDEVYFPYYNNWGDDDKLGEFAKADPLRRALRKEILWTRVQLKHAAKVGSKIRETLPKTQEQIEGLLNNNFDAEGVLQAIKTGNELTAVVGKSLTTLNASITELIQAQAAEGLERNEKEGLKTNRAREALQGWGERQSEPLPAPLNPFGAY